MAIDFDGATDRIDYIESTDWDSTAQSFSFLVYPRDIGASQAYQYFFNKNRSTGVWGIIVASPDLSSGALRVVADGATDMNRQSAAGALTINTWQNVVVTMDGTTNGTGIKIYVNGSEVSYASSQNGVTMSAKTGIITVGGRIEDDLRNADARIAEVARWSRVLTTGEITALGNFNSPKNFPVGLTNHPDLIRDQDDSWAGIAGTLDGTTVTVHPSVFYPKRTKVFTTTAASGPVLLSGFSSTAGLGTLSIASSVTLSLTGNGMTSSLGALSPAGNVNISLDGNVVIVDQGTLSNRIGGWSVAGNTETEWTEQ